MDGSVQLAAGCTTPVFEVGKRFSFPLFPFLILSVFTFWKAPLLSQLAGPQVSTSSFRGYYACFFFSLSFKGVAPMAEGFLLLRYLSSTLRLGFASFFFDGISFAHQQFIIPPAVFVSGDLEYSWASWAAPPPQSF